MGLPLGALGLLVDCRGILRGPSSGAGKDF